MKQVTRILTVTAVLTGAAVLISFAAAGLSREDEELLEDMSRRSFQFFWEQSARRPALLAIGRDWTEGSRQPAPTSAVPAPPDSVSPRCASAPSATGFRGSRRAIAHARR